VRDLGDTILDHLQDGLTRKRARLIGVGDCDPFLVDDALLRAHEVEIAAHGLSLRWAFGTGGIASPLGPRTGEVQGEFVSERLTASPLAPGLCAEPHVWPTFSFTGKALVPPEPRLVP
jgi:hypothetical protein